MYVTDLKKEFYELLPDNHIYIMVHYDVDSVCASKILQNLLKYKNIPYALCIVSGVDDMRRNFRESLQSGITCYLLINCGGTFDIVEVLEPPEDVRFFILDSHRPIDVCNVYSDGQVRLLGVAEDDRNAVPSFTDIFNEDSDSEDETEDAEEREAKRTRLDEETIEKRRQKRLWEANRDQLMLQYYQHTYYARASAVTMFELTWKLNKDDKDALWMAIVSVTEQYLNNKIEASDYVIATGALHTHANRLRNQSNDAEVSTSMKITYEKDLRLILYRHWSVESSLQYSPYTASRLKLWTISGGQKLQQLLVEMGLPLVQSRQSYHSMDMDLRKEFPQTLESVAQKYQLDDLVFTSFVLQYGYRNKYSASDFVYVLLAILEASGKEKSREECFARALECLNRKKDVLDGAVDSAKVMAQVVFRTVQAALDMKRVVIAGPFMYYVIEEGNADLAMFSNLTLLTVLAHALQDGYVSTSKNRKARELPLIVSAPKSVELQTCILLGIPPVCENSHRNILGKAFEEAAEHINCDSSNDHMDISYFVLMVKHRSKFFDALTNLLA